MTRAKRDTKVAKAKGTKAGGGRSGAHNVVVHSLEQAEAALTAAEEAGVAVMLLSPPGAAAYLGVPWFHRMIDQARGNHPAADFEAALDCADAPGLALAAFRHGVPLVRLKAKAQVNAKIADIAKAHGARLLGPTGPALDLDFEADPAAACKAWFAKKTAPRGRG